MNSKAVELAIVDRNQRIIPSANSNETLMKDAPPNRRAQITETRSITAFIALLGGALALGISPIFVRHAEVGPFTSAFWRVALALPALGLWAAIETKQAQAPAAKWDKATICAGLLFAGDLFFWHLAIMKTSVANATFLATMAPVWVLLLSGLVLAEPVTKQMFLGLLMCIIGASGLIGSSLTIANERLAGDLYGVLTSVFFGGYFLAMRFARKASVGTGLLMLRTTMVTAVTLFFAAFFFETNFLPTTWHGYAALFVIAIFCHAGGQGLLAFSLGHLPAGFSSLVIYLEAVAAAFFAWILLGEALTPLQSFGGVIILLGIWTARPKKT